MHVQLTIMYKDLEKYNQGHEVQAASAGREGYPHLVIEKFDRDTMDVIVDTNEIVRREQVVADGMVRGKFTRYIIQKQGVKAQAARTEDLIIDTPIGKISAAIGIDPRNPGIYVSVAGTELVLVEYDSLEEKPVIRVWDHRNPDEDAVYKQVIYPEPEQIG